MIKAHPVAGNRAVGAALPGRAHALYLAQASRLRGDPRHPFDQAPDRRPSRRRRGQGAGPQRQARPRRHPRDRVLRPDPAAHLGRPQSGAAAARHLRDAARARRAGHVEPAAADELIEAYGFLRRVEHRLQMVDDRRPTACPATRRAWRRSPPSSAIPIRASFQKELLDRLHCVEGHYAGCSRRRRASPARAATWCSPAPTTIRARSRPCARWAFAMPRRAAGIVRRWHHGRYPRHRDGARARAPDRADARRS